MKTGKIQHILSNRVRAVRCFSLESPSNPPPLCSQPLLRAPKQGTQLKPDDNAKQDHLYFLLLGIFAENELRLIHDPANPGHTQWEPFHYQGAQSLHSVMALTINEQF